MQFIPQTILLLYVVMFVVSCTGNINIPAEFPTPPAHPAATPIAKIELRRDSELEKLIATIAEEARGKVGVAAVLLETGDAAMLNAEGRYPMQSVYKLPISMAVTEQIRLENLDLEEKIGVTKDDMVREGMRSPLRDKNPNGGEFSIRELIRLSLVESDGTASDVLMRVGGGPGEMQAFLTQIGIKDWKIVNPEKEIGRDWETQYQNWSTPAAAVELLRWLDASRSAGVGNASAGTASGDALTDLLLKDMIESIPGERRLRGLLPKDTVVAHKTGTSGTREGITAATNDIGIITLPTGKRVAIAVFVSDSPGDERTREAVIAKIAKAVWDKWSK